MPSVEELDRQLHELEVSINSKVPEELRRRITTARNLAVYGGFSYDLFTVSESWCFTCLEMALWLKSKEKGGGHSRKTTLKPLLDWAQKYKLMPKHLSDAKASELIAAVRNSLLHPKDFNIVVMPAQAYDAFAMLITCVNSLWSK
jgi:hypothetical protein